MVRSGKVTDGEIKFSELNTPELHQKLLIIVTTMNFGKRPLEPRKGEWTLNVFPG